MEKIARATLPAFVDTVLARLPHKGMASGATILALKGELGSGKTTFAQTLAARLGVASTVQSPTYVLMKSYPLESNSALEESRAFARLVHIDAYRLEKPEDFAALKPEEFLTDPRALVVVEWPERLGSALPAPDLTVSFSSEGASEGERFIEIEK